MLQEFLCHTIYTNALKFANKSPVVLDCGANKGEFCEAMHSLFQAKCFGFEPDPRLFSQLNSNGSINYYELAVGHEDGECCLNLGVAQCSSIRFSEADIAQEVAKVSVVDLEKFCNQHSIKFIDLLKIDIEGAELDLLDGLSKDFFARVATITVEFHDFLNINDLPRIKSVIQKMKQHGFFVLRLSHFTYGDMLMINQNIYPIGVLKKIAFIFYKYQAGIIRFIVKMLRKCLIKISSFRLT